MEDNKKKQKGGGRRRRRRRGRNVVKRIKWWAQTAGETKASG
jgi:hypothetical protein